MCHNRAALFLTSPPLWQNATSPPNPPEIEQAPEVEQAPETEQAPEVEQARETHPAIEIARACQTGAGAPREIPGARYVLPAPPVIKPSR